MAITWNIIGNISGRVINENQSYKYLHIFYSKCLWLHVARFIGSLIWSQYGQSPFSLMLTLLLKELTFTLYLLFTAACVVPCGGPKKSRHTSSIVQIIFSFWSFEISDDILRNQKFILSLDTFI